MCAEIGGFVSRITVGMLRELGACEGQIVVFEREWPDGAEVTKDNVVRALEIGLRVGSIVHKRCSSGAICQYLGLVGEAHSAMDGPWRVYREKVAEAFMEAWGSK